MARQAKQYKTRFDQFCDYCCSFLHEECPERQTLNPEKPEHLTILSMVATFLGRSDVFEAVDRRDAAMLMALKKQTFPGSFLGDTEMTDLRWRRLQWLCILCVS